MKILMAALLALQMQASVADLGWLAGRWETAAEGRWTEEAWLAPRGGAMLGASRSGRDAAMREFEFLRIATGEDGVPVYLAQPGGRPPVAFRLVAHERMSVTFENAQHDFPQRIRYVRTGGTLVATISRIDGSNAMSWTYRRRDGGGEQDQAD